jgi:Fic family protein
MFKPQYRLTKYLSESLERTTLLLESLKNLPSKSPIRIKITRDALGRDVHSSTWIEGNMLTLAQVNALVDGKDVDAESQQKTEVKNCINVLRWIIKHKSTPFTSNRILQLHGLMTKGLLVSDRSGHWRKVQNYVVNSKRQVIFTPPKPKDVPKRMGELLTWLSKSKEEHAVVRSAIFHHEFVTIHPFVDGNGRMARALSQWVLFQGKYDPAHSLGLDEYFAGDRAKYYEMIQETREMDRDFTHWIEYFALGLLQSVENLSKRLRSVKMDGKEWTPKQRELIKLLNRRGILGSGDICRAMGINRARVNQLISPLISAGVVLKEGHTRSSKYRTI